TEQIYQNLVVGLDPKAKESIHLCDYPTVDEKMIDKQLEADMDAVLKVKTIGLAARNAANIKSRQPIGKMYVKAGEDVAKMSEEFQAVVKDELNVKEIVFTDDVREFTSYTFKPQLKTVGPKYGKQLKGIQEYLANVDGNAAMDTLKSEGAIKFDVNGTEVALAEEDLLITMAQKEGFVAEADGGVTVVMDTNLTEELIEEGFVNDVISKLQNLRKSSGFEVMDRISVALDGNDKIAEIVKKNVDAIATKVLADAVEYGKKYENGEEMNINGEKVTITVKKN
ncbi:MAG: isoleucine--tRNA ligase, partial [Lachnospiraceae bacterium]|nr:isoleucine--tRNA ligase [Lachnospiraceae bacterium]